MTKITILPKNSAHPVKIERPVFPSEKWHRSAKVEQEQRIRGLSPKVYENTIRGGVDQVWTNISARHQQGANEKVTAHFVSAEVAGMMDALSADSFLREALDANPPEPVLPPNLLLLEPSLREAAEARIRTDILPLHIQTAAEWCAGAFMAIGRSDPFLADPSQWARQVVLLLTRQACLPDEPLQNNLAMGIRVDDQYLFALAFGSLTLRDGIPYTRTPRDRAISALIFMDEYLRIARERAVTSGVMP